MDHHPSRRVFFCEPGARCAISRSIQLLLAQYLLARYRSEEAVPAYLLRENLPVVRERLSRIELVTSPAQEFIGQQPDDSIDCFSLSNICELMSPDETARLFAEVARSADLVPASAFAT